MLKHTPQPLSRTNQYLAFLWPVLALLCCAVLWTVAVYRAHAETARAEQLVLKEADAYAQAYEQYLSRSIAQMDQITMQLKHSWEHSYRPTLLEDMRSDGMFTDDAFVSVSVIGADGRVLSSTRGIDPAASFGQAKFFIQHRNNISTALRVGTAPPGLRAGRDAVLFTRRVDRNGDEFDGVVVMAVDASYFTSFVGPSVLGRDGLLVMAGTESKLQVEQRGAGGAAGAEAMAPRGIALAPRAIALAGASGSMLIDGADGFRDGVARVTGWRRSAAYPVVALVALSHREAVAAANVYWQESRDHALVATLCLLVLAGFASLLSLRAAARERDQDEVRRAYRTATESANDGFYMVAPQRDRRGRIVDFRIVDCNERGAYFYGLTRGELVGRLVSEIDSGLAGMNLVDSYRLAMSNGFHEEDRRMPADGRLNIVWGRRRLVRVGGALAVTLQDISERKAHEDQMARLANEDSLTGLPNRHWLLHYIPSMIARARAEEGSLALLFIDLDEFKQVNDSHGHAVGDRLLAAAAQRLVALLRPTDRVARFGGDEFVVLLQPARDEIQVAGVAERIVDAFQAPFAIGDGMHASVGASVGISMYPRDGLDASTLIRHADIAMYAGKNDGKGQHRFFDHALSGNVRKRAQLKQWLLAAVDQDQFQLHYQPRVDAGSGVLLSMEALLRWPHPAVGMIPPGDFIPLAESSGLIVQIGELVIDKACAQLAAWRAAGLALVPVSINVSAKQFARGGVMHHLQAALNLHAVPPSLIEVELTESAMMGEQDEVVAELAAIRALGIKLHVDDFGTGYSSLSQLQRLRMDVLKVDRAFTAELDRSSEGRVFFQAIVSMAHALGMSVVAEGVETAAQLAILRELQCNEVQGYFISRPLPPDALAAQFLAAADAGRIEEPDWSMCDTADT
jgi:diguanylate cyclase (GGDEF)-like protein